MRIPAVGVTYPNRDTGFIDGILPLVDYLEVTPDAIAVSVGGRHSIPRGVLDRLEAYARELRIVIHGVGLSIGSADSWSDGYLRLLDQLMERVPIAWHSEHLGYVAVEGQHLGTMLPVPRTHEALDLVTERVSILMTRYQLPFLLENVVRLIPEPMADYTDAQFLNAISDRSGCGFLLDLYNLECDVQNNGFAVESFLDELSVSRVHEIHVASGVEQEGVLLDIHSRPLRDSTLAMLKAFLTRPAADVDLVTYELVDEAVSVLGAELICHQLRRLRAALPHRALAGCATR